MVAPIHLFGTLLTGRALHNEGKMFMAKPVTYLAGATALGVLAWLIFGDGGTANAAPSCAGVDGLREPLRSQVKAAMADPNITADKLESLAQTIDQIPPPYSCPAAAAQVRAAAKAKVIGPTPPYTPPPVPHGPTIGCSPTTQQSVAFGVPMTPEQIAAEITGDRGKDQEFMNANQPASGPGWAYRYRIDVYDGTPGAPGTTKTSTYVTFDHYVHPSEITSAPPYAEMPPNSQVTWESVTVAAGKYVHVPLSWSKYFVFRGKYSGGTPDYEIETGVAHPPCA